MFWKWIKRIKEGVSNTANGFLKKTVMEMICDKTEVRECWKEYFRNPYGNDSGTAHS